MNENKTAIITWKIFLHQLLYFVLPNIFTRESRLYVTESALDNGKHCTSTCYYYREAMMQAEQPTNLSVRERESRMLITELSQLLSASSHL